MGKKISIKTICVSAIISVLIFHIFITVISSDIRGVEGSNNEEATIEEVSQEEKLQDMFGKDDMNEVSLEDGRTFKLFEKKRLQHKKAETFCKNREGKLVRGINLDEMRRLQLLLVRARMIGDQIWIGADKKLWKKHALKKPEMDRPNLGPDVMMFGGGGPTEMCPALSTSTRSLTPAPCHHQLPFICEFDPGKGKLKKTAGDKNKMKPTKTMKKKLAQMRDEMRRKREVLNTTLSSQEMEDEEDEENSNNTSTITSVIDLGSAEVLNPRPPIRSAHPDEDFIAAHKIGFFPRVVAASAMQNSTQYNMPVSDTQTSDNFKGEIERTSPKKRLADVHLKFSTKLMLQPDTTINDPDQQMLDLINEESLNVLDDANVTGEITTANTTFLSDKLISILNENSIVLKSTQSTEELTSESDMIQEKSTASTIPPMHSTSKETITQPTTMTSPDLERGIRGFSQTTNINSTVSQQSVTDPTTSLEMITSVTTKDPEVGDKSITDATSPTGTNIEIESSAESIKTTSNTITAETNETVMSTQKPASTSTESMTISYTSGPSIMTMTSTAASITITTDSMTQKLEKNSTPESTIRPNPTNILMTTIPSNTADQMITKELKTTEFNKIFTTASQMFTTIRQMSTPATTLDSNSENPTIQMTVTSPKTTSNSMTANAPKTTIDPMTKPMSPMDSTSTESITDSTPEINRGGKSFSDPGKLTPTTNVTGKTLTGSHPKEGINTTFPSLLHPSGTTVTPKTSTSSSTNSPAALLTLRVKPTVGSRSSKLKRPSTSTIGATGNVAMKSSVPTTLLKPQNLTKLEDNNRNGMPIMFKLDG